MRNLLIPLLLAVAALAAPFTEDTIVPEFVQQAPKRWVGTHNSYHVQPSAYTLAVMNGVGLKSIADEIAYTHEPIEDQIAKGAVTFELDIFADPDGGAYATLSKTGPYHPFTTIAPVMAAIGQSLGMKGKLGATETAYTQAETVKMTAPGFKVQHIQDIDFKSNCGLTLQECLTKVDKTEGTPWVLLEIKDKPPKTGNAQIDAGIPWAKAISPKDKPSLWDDLEQELAAFPNIKFMLDNADLSKSYAAQMTRKGVTSPKIAINAKRLTPSEAQDLRNNGFSLSLICNDPSEKCYDGKSIKDIVASGEFVVRTRADADEKQFNAERAKDALKTCAQVVHTDYLADMMKMVDVDCTSCTDGFYSSSHGHSCQELRAHANGGAAGWTDSCGTSAGDVCVHHACKAQCECKITKHDVAGATCTPK